MLKLNIIINKINKMYIDNDIMFSIKTQRSTKLNINLNRNVLINNKHLSYIVNCFYFIVII